MKSAPQNLYEFAQYDCQKIHRELQQLTRRRIVAVTRRLWEMLGRPPQFSDLTEATLRQFASWLALSKSTATANESLRHFHMLAATAVQEGHISSPVPYLQLTGAGRLELREVKTRRAPESLRSAGWSGADLTRLLEIFAASTGNVAGVPSATWWGCLAVLVLDTGVGIADCLTLRWEQLAAGRITIPLRKALGEHSAIQTAKSATLSHVETIPIRSPRLIKLLADLKAHGQEQIFPTPNQRNAISTLYKRLESMLTAGDLYRRVYRCFDTLRKASPLMNVAVLDELAGLVKFVPPGTPDAMPPVTSGPRLRIPGKTVGLRTAAAVDVAAPAPEIKLDGTWTLRKFYDAYMVPIVLDGKREVSEKSKKLYADALAWWELLTDDPSLSAITDFTWMGFAAGLREAQFKRGANSDARRLSEVTQHKHQRQLRAILRIARKKDLCREIDTSLRKPTSETKPPFSLEDAKQICQFLRSQKEPAAPAKPPRQYIRQEITLLGAPAPIWLAFVAAAFYTGLRSGSLLQLRWGMLQVDDDAWLEVPGGITKTGKGVRVALHPCLLEALSALTRGGPDALVFDFDGCYRHILSCHERLQRLAGIPDERIQSPHAWRRTHATQIALTGLTAAIEKAQIALSHSSSETTLTHYLGGEVHAAAVKSLPRLW